MSRSGYKRGLATAAVSALAITGLPLFAGTAHAEPITDQYGATQVELLSLFSGQASLKNDGQNTTVRLEAAGGASVTNVLFEYRIGAGPWNAISTVDRNDDGAFMFEWNATGVAGATVEVRATGITAAAGDVEDTDSRSAVINGGGAAVEAVNLNDGTDIGAFQQPYAGPQNGTTMVVSGTTSATAGSVDLFWFPPTTGEPTAGGMAPVTAPAGATTGTFKGIVNIEGYDFTNSPDQISIGAQRGSDDVETYGIYDQQITTVTAEPASTTRPVGSPDRDIVVTVLDQNGKPIAGAEVYSSENDEDQDPGTAGFQGDPKYTDANGQATFKQDAGTEYYYANATASPSYEPVVGDKRSNDVTVTEYNPAPTSLSATSRDGAAFDMDENNSPAGGTDVEPMDSDIKVTLKDQNGSTLVPNAGQTLNYYWVRTPFAGGAATPTRFPATGTWSVTDGYDGAADGTFQVSFPKNAASGTFELRASLSEVPITGGGNVAESAILTVQAGQASITYDEASPEDGPAGGEEVVDGQLVLENGTGLPGRTVELSLAYDAAASTFDDPTPDAKFSETGGLSAGPVTRTTGADGAFSATIKDPAETPQLAEIGDIVDARTLPGTPDADDPSVTYAATPNQVVNFLVSTTVGSITISPADAPEERPGDLEAFNVTVMSGDQDPNTAGVQAFPLSRPVNLTTDHGYFTDGIPQGAVGDPAGVYDNDGQAKTITSDSNGNATFFIAIGRDTGFDDDGKVTGNITATSGGISDSEAQTWTSADPLNPGTVVISFAEEEEQQSTILPQARTNQWVALDVRTFDQFGNRVGGEVVNLNDDADDEDAQVDFSATSDFNDGDIDAYADAQDTVDQTITATWTQDTEVLVADGADAGSAPDVADGPDKSVTDDITIEWYEIDWDATTYTIESSTGDTASVNEKITITVTVVDQEGQPVSGLPVEFIRQGPGTGSGDSRWFDNTDVNGEATYPFTAEEDGTVDIFVTVEDGNGTPVADLQTTITVEGDVAPPVDIVAELLGANNGKKDDVLTVSAPNKAAGATVKLFKVKKSGQRVLVGEDVLNGNGDRKFEVNDGNGANKTKYVAKVKGTEATNPTQTNTKSVK